MACPKPPSSADMPSVWLVSTSWARPCRRSWAVGRDLTRDIPAGQCAPETEIRYRKPVTSVIWLPAAGSDMHYKGEVCMEQFAPVKRSKDGQPVRYLIVDDSVFARKNLARMIETFGGQVAAEAGDGLTAISEFDRTHPDIVLMDITMPQMEGIEAAERIVQQHPEARIVMVSSVGYQENIVAALQRGARHFVQKPVKPEVLYEVIKYVLGEDGAVAGAAGAGV